MKQIKKASLALTSISFVVVIAVAASACNGSSNDNESDTDPPPNDSESEKIDDYSLYPEEPGEYFSVDESGFTAWANNSNDHHVSYSIFVSNTHDSHAVLNAHIEVEWVDGQGEVIDQQRGVHELKWVSPGGQAVLADSVSLDEEPSDFNLVFADPEDGFERNTNWWVEYDAVDGEGGLEVLDFEFTQDDASQASLEADVTVESSLPWEMGQIWTLAVWRDDDDQIIGGSRYGGSHVDIEPGTQTVDFFEQAQEIPEGVDLANTEIIAQATDFTTGIDPEVK